MQPPQISDYLMKMDLPGRMLYARIGGSWSHNVATEDSDVDLYAVYVEPTDNMLGLWTPRESIVSKDPDMAAHEVRKFATLLMKGNPNVVEMLFSERMQYMASEWKELRAFRHVFLSARTVRQYLGYAQGQLKKLENKQPLHTTGGEYNTKWAYHIVRLVKDALRIVTGGHPCVWMEGQQRDYFLRIRAGEFSVTQIGDKVREVINEVDGMRPWPWIPSEPDTKFLNDWLLRVRKAGV